MFRKTKQGHKAQNIKLDGVTYDTGWKLRTERMCYTDWIRYIKTSRDPESIADELTEAGDHDGWTGVEYAKGYDKDGMLAFVSVYDSGD